MAQFSFETEVNAKPEQIWEMYSNLNNRFIWESDLEKIILDGDFVTGSSGTMKLAGMPEMSFSLTNVIPNREFWDKTNIPGGMALCFGHVLKPHGNKTVIIHTVRLEKYSGDILPEDIQFLSQVFSDTPQAVLAIKEAVEKLNVSLEIQK